MSESHQHGWETVRGIDLKVQGHPPANGGLAGWGQEKTGELEVVPQKPGMEVVPCSELEIEVKPCWKLEMEVKPRWKPEMEAKPRWKPEMEVKTLWKQEMEVTTLHRERTSNQEKPK